MKGDSSKLLLLEGMLYGSTQPFSHKNEEEWREGVPLADASWGLKGGGRDSINQYGEEI